MSAVLLLVAAAAAAPLTSTLSWVRLDGAEACLAAPELAAAVEARLGRPVFASPAAAELNVEGRAEAGEAGWRAVLRLSDRSGALLGERVVESPAETCEELGRAVVVTLALMIEPATAPPPPAPSPAPPPPAPRWAVELDGALFAGAGLVPGAGVGALGALVLTPPGFLPLRVQGGVIPYAPLAAAGDDAALLRLDAGLLLCPLDLHRGTVTLRACLGVDVGAGFVVAGGAGLTATERVLVQGHGLLGAHWNVVDRWVLRAGLHPVVPFRAQAYTRAEDGVVLWSAPPVAGYADVGLGLLL